MTTVPSNLKPLNRDEEAVLRSLTRLLQGLPRALDAELDRAQRISLNEYHTLMHLSHSPNHQLRMSELAHRCNLSLSGMTRIVARLEAEGFVQRTQDTNDGRGANAVLTDPGMARLQEAWPTFLAAARRYIFDPLKGLPLHELGQALDNCAKIADSAAR